MAKLDKDIEEGFKRHYDYFEWVEDYRVYRMNFMMLGYVITVIGGLAYYYTEFFPASIFMVFGAGMVLYRMIKDVMFRGDY